MLPRICLYCQQLRLEQLKLSGLIHKYAVVNSIQTDVAACECAVERKVDPATVVPQCERHSTLKH